MCRASRLLNLVVNTGEQSASLPGRFVPRKEALFPILKKAKSNPKSVWMFWKKKNGLVCRTPIPRSSIPCLLTILTELLAPSLSVYFHIH